MHSGCVSYPLCIYVSIYLSRSLSLSVFLCIYPSISVYFVPPLTRFSRTHLSLYLASSFALCFPISHQHIVYIFSTKLFPMTWFTHFSTNYFTTFLFSVFFVYFIFLDVVNTQILRTVLIPRLSLPEKTKRNKKHLENQKTNNKKTRINVKSETISN